VDRLEEFVTALSGVASKDDYEGLHADFCNWFTKRICTAGKQFKSGRSNPSCPCSYGEAAKVLDVAAKVYVYYCALPSPEVATRLIPLQSIFRGDVVGNHVFRGARASAYRMSL
jgi:hypothetical protein